MFYQKGQPGVVGTQGVGVELGAPVISRSASGAVGPAESKTGIKIIVRAYLNMNEGDTVYLSYGEQTLTHVVAINEVGKDIEFTVQESDIKAEGDGKIQVYYYVESVVGAESEWSQDAYLEVRLAPTALAAPEVLDDKGVVITQSVIEIASLSSSDVIVQINGTFQTNDSLVLHFVATNAQGQSTSIDFGPQKVADPSKPQQFKVPATEWVRLGGGEVRLSYTLTPNAGAPNTSMKTTINIKGLPLALPAPELDDAEEDWVDADLQDINMVIPAAANLAYKDTVTMVYSGIQSNGAPLSIPGQTYKISGSMPGKPFSDRLKGPTFLKPFEGGYVYVSYTVTRGGQVFKSAENLYYIGEPVESLPAPTTRLPISNGVVDPSLTSYKYNMVIDIPTGAVTPLPCTIYLHWERSDGIDYMEENEVASGESGPWQFVVPASFYELSGGVPVDVRVYYAIEWPGKPIAASKDLEFKVATAAMQNNFAKAPTVPLAANGKLNLTKIVDNFLTVRIDDTGLKAGDEIVIKVGTYVASTYLLATNGVQEFKLPLDRVLAQNMQSVLDPVKFPLSVSYEHVLNGTKVPKVSHALPLVLEGAVTRERFEGFGRRPIRTELDLPALRIVMKKGVNSVNLAYVRAGTHARALVVGGYHNTHTRFELRGLAKKVQFYLTGHTIRNNAITFYTAAGTPIKTINTLFNRTPGRVGYQPYTELVTFSSPGAAIAAFEFVESHGDANHYIFDISYEPF